MAKVDYKALLEEAKQQKMEAERVIAFAERMLGMSRSSPSSLAKTQELQQPPEIMDDTFHGKNILQATQAYLEMVGRPARSTEEIAGALVKGGLSATAPSVATILGRSKGSGVQRVKRGLWGLSEWYGNQGS
jgi:hypothetical protein